MGVVSLTGLQFFDGKMLLKQYAAVDTIVFRSMNEATTENSTQSTLSSSLVTLMSSISSALPGNMFENSTASVAPEISPTFHNSSTATADLGEQLQPKLEYPDYKARFPIPDSLEEFLTSQPPATHDKLLKDPSEKFIVLTCHKFASNKIEACGGVADRLKNIAYWVWLAQKSGRRLLIKYSKPFPLEKFLVLPDGSQFDWRLPDGYFDNELEAYANRTFDQYREMRRYDWHTKVEQSPWNSTRVIFVNNNLAMPPMVRKMQSLFHESYDQHIIPGIFRRLFHTSPGVQAVVDQTAKEHGLVAGKYASAHLRLKYPFKPPKRLVLAAKNADKNGGGLAMDDNRTAWNVHLLSDNAINCAMQAMPEARQVYFASDSNEAAQYLLHESAWSRAHKGNVTTLNVTNIQNDIPKVVARLDIEEEPVHFDSGLKREPSAFYATFVDLWIMAHSKCISHGAGGFGQFVSRLTGNFDSCRVETRSRKGDIHYCAEYLNQFGLNLPERRVIPH